MNNTKKCANCNAESSLQAKFCIHCGTPFPVEIKRPTHCSQCGALLASESNFCGVCGQKVEVGTPPSMGESMQSQNDYSTCHQAAISKKENSGSQHKTQENNGFCLDQKQKVCLVLAALLLIVSIVVAYAVEMNTSMIYDGEKIAPASDLHIGIVTSMWIVSSLLLVPISKSFIFEPSMKKKQKMFHIFLALAGLFFANATEKGARILSINDYYDGMLGAPSWYSDDSVSEGWFEFLPNVAAELTAPMILSYILAVAAVAVAVWCAYQMYRQYV